MADNLIGDCTFTNCLDFPSVWPIFAINDAASVIGRWSLRPSRHSQPLPAVTDNHCAISRSGAWAAIDRPRDGRVLLCRSPHIKQVAASSSEVPRSGWCCARCSPTPGTTGTRLREPSRRGRHAPCEGVSRRAQAVQAALATPSAAGSEPYGPGDPRAVLAAQYFPKAQHSTMR